MMNKKKNTNKKKKSKKETKKMSKIEIFMFHLALLCFIFLGTAPLPDELQVAILSPHPELRSTSCTILPDYLRQA